VFALLSGAIKNGNIKKQVQSRSEKQVQRAMTLHDFGLGGQKGTAVNPAIAVV